MQTTTEEIQPLSEAQKAGLLQVIGVSQADAGLVTYIENCATDKPRILILYNYRLFFGKIAGRGVKAPQLRSTICHILDVREIVSTSAKSVNIIMRSGLNMEIKLPSTDVFVAKFRSVLLGAFPNMPMDEAPILTIDPPSRIPDIHMGVQASCGAYIFALQCAWSFFNCQNVQTLNENIRLIYRLSSISSDVFNFNEFEFSSVEEVKALMLSLSYNTWFRKIVIKRRELVREMFTFLGDCLRKNRTITDIDISDIDVPKELLAEFFEKIAANQNSSIQRIRIPSNIFDERGIAGLSKAIESLPHGIIELMVNGCGLDRSSINPIFQAIKKSDNVSTTLKRFSIAYNKLNSDSSLALGGCLSSTSSLEELDLSSTGFKMEHVVNGISQGCLATLQTIDMSRNKLGKKEVALLCSVLKAAVSLKKLNLSETELSVESAAEVIAALQSNQSLTNITLNISGNDFGGGSPLPMGQTLANSTCITFADVSDCNLGDEGLASFVTALIPNKSLFEINLSGNYRQTGKPSKAAEALAKYVQESNIGSLILRGTHKGAWRQDLQPFVEGLDCNTTLKKLDISSNFCSDKVIISLAKSLYTNRGLVSLALDDNSITMAGLEYLRNGLSYNTFITMFPIPIIDIGRMAKESDKVMQSKLHSIVESIQSCLMANQNLKLSDLSISQDNYQAMPINSKSRSFYYAHPKHPLLGSDIELMWKHSPVYQTLNVKKLKIQEQVVEDLMEIFDKCQEQINRILDKSFVDFRHTISETAAEVYGILGSDKVDQLDNITKAYQRTLDRDEILALTRDEVADRLGARYARDMDKVLDAFSLASSKMTLEYLAHAALEKFNHTGVIQQTVAQPSAASPLPSPRNQLHTQSSASRATATYGFNLLSLVGRPDQNSKQPASGPPQKPAPKAPSRKSVVPAAPERRTRAFRPEEINLKAIEADGNLSHLTLDRAPLQKKRPPTRVPQAGFTGFDLDMPIQQ